MAVKIADKIKQLNNGTYKLMDSDDVEFNTLEGNVSVTEAVNSVGQRLLNFIETSNKNNTKTEKSISEIEEKILQIESGNDYLTGDEANKRYSPHGVASGKAPYVQYAIESNALNYRIYGNSSQETRTGYNLFPDFIADKTFDKGSFIKVRYDKSILIYKALNDKIDIIKKINLPQGDYILSSGNANGSIVYLALTYTVNGSKTTISTEKKGAVSFSITEAQDVKIQLYGSSGGTNSGTVIIYPMLISGTESKSYEPYGGTTPSPEIPCEVQFVGDLVTDETNEYFGKYEIKTKVCGKNLFNATSVNSGWYIETYGEIAPNSKYCYAPIIKCLQNTKYYLSSNLEVYSVLFYDNDKMLSKNFLNSASKSFTTPNKCNNLRITFKYKGEAFEWAQLERGSAATDYEPYRENVLTTYLDEPLRNVGNYSDYIDWANKKVVRNVFCYTFTGDESWVIGSDSDEYSTCYATVENIREEGVAKANMYVGYSEKGIFDGKSTAISSGDTEHCQFNINGSFYARINKSRCSDALNPMSNDWNNIYSAGTKIYGVCSTPQEQELTSEQMPLQNGSNSIITDIEIQPSNIEITYYQNLAEAFDELRQAIIALQSSIN